LETSTTSAKDGKKLVTKNKKQNIEITKTLILLIFTPSLLFNT